MASGGAVASQPIDASTPWVAAADGNLPLLQASLAKLELGVGSKDQSGYTLLQAAASYSQIVVLQWILAQNVNIQDVDCDGDSALHYASTMEACKILVENGIDIQIRNSSGHTALATKQLELNELMEDEDYEENDPDSVTLKKLVDYLVSLNSRPQ